MTSQAEIEQLKAKLERLEADAASRKGLIAEGPAKGQPNPFSRRYWNVTKQGELIKTHGLEVAQAAAEACGAQFGGTKGGDL